MSHSLAEYYRQLRDEHGKGHVLDRESVEAMSEDEIAAELAKRKWGRPRSTYAGFAGQHKTWVKYFLEQQELRNRGLHNREVARRAKVDPAVIWKLATGKPVKLATIRSVWVNAFGFTEDGPEMRRAAALWTGARTAVKVDAAFETEVGEVQHAKSFNDFLARAVPVLAAIPAGQYDSVLEALSNPATVESLAALNKLAAEGGKPRLRVVPKPRK